MRISLTVLYITLSTSLLSLAFPLPIPEHDIHYLVAPRRLSTPPKLTPPKATPPKVTPPTSSKAGGGGTKTTAALTSKTSTSSSSSLLAVSSSSSIGLLTSSVVLSTPSTPATSSIAVSSPITSSLAASNTAVSSSITSSLAASNTAISSSVISSATSDTAVASSVISAPATLGTAVSSSVIPAPATSDTAVPSSVISSPVTSDTSVPSSTASSPAASDTAAASCPLYINPDALDISSRDLLDLEKRAGEEFWFRFEDPNAGTNILALAARNGAKNFDDQAYKWISTDASKVTRGKIQGRVPTVFVLPAGTRAALLGEAKDFAVTKAAQQPADFVTKVEEPGDVGINGIVSASTPGGPIPLDTFRSKVIRTVVKTTSAKGGGKAFFKTITNGKVSNTASKTDQNVMANFC